MGLCKTSIVIVTLYTNSHSATVTCVVSSATVCQHCLRTIASIFMATVPWQINIWTESGCICSYKMQDKNRQVNIRNLAPVFNHSKFKVPHWSLTPVWVTQISAGHSSILHGPVIVTHVLPGWVFTNFYLSSDGVVCTVAEDSYVTIVCTGHYFCIWIIQNQATSKCYTLIIIISERLRLYIFTS